VIATWVRDRNGSYYLNQAQRYVKGGIFVAQNDPVVTPAATLVAGTLNPGISPVQIIDSPEDSLTEMFALAAEHAPGDPADVQQRLSVEITDVAWRRRLMNGPIPVNHVFGDRFMQHKMLETIFLEQQQTLQLQFSNRSLVAASNYRPALRGRKFQASAMINRQVSAHINAGRPRKRFLQPYWLGPQQPIVIPANGQVDAFYLNTRDVFTTLFRRMAFAITAGGAPPSDTQEMFSFQIFDAVTNRPLSNQPVTMNCGAGTAQFPFEMATPICMDPNTLLRIHFFNLITDAVTEVFFTFGGVASYVGPGQMSARAAEIAPPGAYYVGVP
jgi:hypothetical protein